MIYAALKFYFYRLYLKVFPDSDNSKIWINAKVVAEGKSSWIQSISQSPRVGVVSVVGRNLKDLESLKNCK